MLIERPQHGLRRLPESGMGFIFPALIRASLFTFPPPTLPSQYCWLLSSPKTLISVPVEALVTVVVVVAAVVLVVRETAVGEM